MRGPGKAAIASLVLIALVALVDLWLVSAGRFVDWPEYGDYTELLADAFGHRQLSLLLEPDPALLALRDPYDARATRTLRLHDAALFEGKYYLYWGPVPALLVAGAKALGIGHVGDQHVTYLFLLGTLFWIALLLHVIWRRWFADCPYWTLATAILVAGLATPAPSLLARASVYEVAIVGGQFFLLGGIYWALTAFTGASVSMWRLLLAGLFWAAALGTRLSLPPLILVLIVAAALAIRRCGRPLALAAIMVAPVLCAVAALGFYNYARFGSVAESGQRYMLAGRQAYQTIAAGHMFSPRYVVANSLNYLLAPPARLDRFPYVELGKGLRWFRAERAVRHYQARNIAGIVVTVPYLGLAAIPLLRRLRRRDARVDGLTLALWAAGIGAAVAPGLFLFYCTIRYVGDWAPLLVILSATGIWSLQRDWAGRPERRRILAAAVALLVIWGVVVGVLLGITGEFRHFETQNPELFQRLERL